MNADRLLAHFEKISEAPHAVDRLRRFVLDLAVRGKLVEQDPGEGTATDLLSQHRVVAEASGEMQPFPLPNSWAWVPVGVVCSKTGSGSTPRGGKTAYVSKGIPFLRSQNVHDDGLTLDDVAYIDAATHSKMIGTAVHPDDLLLNITGGSMGRCCHVPSSFREGNVSQHVAILRVAIPGTQAFLHKCIISPFFQSLIFDEQTGAGRGGLPKNRMDRLPVPLPPLAEQHRIVEKVDELMQLCDRLEASQAERETRRDRLVASSLNRLGSPDGSDPDEFKKDAGFQLSNLNRLSTKREHIQEIRKAILNLAVRGKLVKQEESAISVAKTLGITATKEPTDLPRTWIRLTLGQIALRMDSGWSPQCEKVRRTSSEEWAVLRTTSVQPLAFDCREHKVLPPKLTPRPQYEAQEGDLLVTRAGPKNRVGVCCVVDRVEPRLMISDKLIRVHVRDGLSPHFIALALNTGESQAAMEASKSGMAVMQMNVSQDKLKAIHIPLPPLAEQKRIVAKVDELMAICDQLEKQLESQQKDSRRLLEALLHEALGGAGEGTEKKQVHGNHSS